LVAELYRAAQEVPRRAFVAFKGARLTYAEVDRQSDELAAGLYALGLRPGERLALLLPNCPQFVLAQFAAWKLGAIVVPINPLYAGDELAGPLVETGATWLLALSPFYEKVKQVQARTRIGRVLVTNIKEHLPPRVRLLFTLFVERRQGHRARLRDGDLWLRDLTRRGQGPPPGTAPQPADPAVIMMSGGTTGAPKGVIGLHQALIVTALQLRAWYHVGARDGVDTLLLPLPLFHSYGTVGVLPFAVMTRNSLALVPNPRDLDDLLATARRERPSLFLGVPTLFNALVNHPRLRRGAGDLASLRVSMSGAAPLLAETKRRFEELARSPILEGYSLTEAMVAAALNPFEGQRKLGSVGLPLPDVEMRIVDAEEGTRPLPAGEVGEILIRAPQVMPGYWERADETAEALRAHDDGPPFLHTGDLGYFDPDGYLFIVDRKKDLMKPGGLQVWPREVEEALAAHPAVAEVGVAGVMDAARGEIVKAWVVLRPGAAATTEELRGWCKQRLAPFKVPAQIAFRTELPKSLVGKVLRRALVAEDRAASDA
jgi:long-chain acyl-CoA synthetase